MKINIVATPKSYLKIHAAIFKRSKLDVCKQSGSLSVGHVTDENYIMFPVDVKSDLQTKSFV